MYYLIYEWNGRWSTCKLLQIETDLEIAKSKKIELTLKNVNRHITYELREFKNETDNANI